MQNSKCKMHNCLSPHCEHFAFCILHFALFFLESGLAANHFAPIQVAPLQAHDEHLRACQIGGNGDIVLITVPDGFDHLAVIPGIGIVGVGEQQDQIDLVIGDPGIDLLVAALLMGQKKGNGQTGIVTNQPSGGSGGIQAVLGKHTLICGTELNHQFFFLVMR